MATADVGAWLMLVSGGLWAGGILMFAMERTNLWRRMPIEQYVVDFRRSVLRVDPLLPILGGTSCVGGVLFAVNNGGRNAALSWIAIALVGVVIVSSLRIAEPINSQFRRLPEGQAPEGVADLRTRWRRFHAARNVVALAAFVCMVAAVA